MIHGRIRLLISLSFAVFSVHAAAGTVTTQSVRVYFHESTGFVGAKRTKLDSVAALLEKVVNSGTFRTAVLNHRTRAVKENGKVVTSKTFVQNEGLSNAKVLDSIYQATEDFYREPEFNAPKANRIADFFVSLYSGEPGVVGHTTTGRRLIQINDTYFSSMSRAYMAGNLMHEWLHKLGFSHDANSTARRPYSVPYAIGNIVRELGANLTGGNAVKVHALGEVDAEFVETDE